MKTTISMFLTMQFFLITSTFGQVLVIESCNYKIVREFFDNNSENALNEKVILIVFCSQSNVGLIKMINTYRRSKKLEELQISVRLDTLSRNVAIYNAVASSLVHHSSIPTFKNISDLLNVENLYFSSEFTDTLNTDSNLELIFQTWQDSFHHNENMLIDSHDVGSVAIGLKISRMGKSFFKETFAVFESDFHISARELNEKYNEANRRIWDTKKFKKSTVADH